MGLFYLRSFKFKMIELTFTKPFLKIVLLADLYVVVI